MDSGELGLCVLLSEVLDGWGGGGGSEGGVLETSLSLGNYRDL